MDDFLDSSSTDSNNSYSGETQSLQKAFQDRNMTTKEILYKSQVESLIKEFVSKEDLLSNQLMKKLLKKMGLEENNTITVNQFIDGYIKFENKIRKTIERKKQQIVNDEDYYKDLEYKCKTYKNEKKNLEGLTENSKVKIQINSIEIDESLLERDFLKILFKFVINDKKGQSFTFKPNKPNAIVNKIFELQLRTLDDKVLITLMGNDIENIGEEEKIGSAVIDLTEDIFEEGKNNYDFCIKGGDNDSELIKIKSEVEIIYSLYSKCIKEKNLLSDKIKTNQVFIHKYSKIVDGMHSIYSLYPIKKKKDNKGKGAEIYFKSDKEYKITKSIKTDANENEEDKKDENEEENNEKNKKILNKKEYDNANNNSVKENKKKKDKEGEAKCCLIF